MAAHPQLDAEWRVPSAAMLIAAASLASWIYLVFARGWFWRLRAFDDDQAEVVLLKQWPRVVALVPARNEAEVIARTAASLIQQDYPGEFTIILVDDHSEDDTAEFARRTATACGALERFSIHSAAPLPAEWTGKLWALNEGVTRAAKEAPEFYWFTDADVAHAPDTLRRLVARAETGKLDLASLMVLLQARTLPERAQIPAFLYFFLKLYPPRWIADSNKSTAGAAGGCMLLRRTALEHIGGLAAIRGEVIDDCALAREVKNAGGRIWMGLTRASISLRVYRSFGEIRDMIARTAFTQLGYSAFVLFGTLAGMLLTYAAPIGVLFAHDSIARILGAAAWALMALSFLPTVRFYRLSPFWALLLPLSALFYSYATWVSAMRYWLGRGGRWKGRAQAPRAAKQSSH
jgi:hopene-associated glycosyltransferase HpnB